MSNLNTSSRYTIAGIAFGLLFPMVATIGLSIENNWTLLETQFKGGWLLWIIDTAPIFIGLFSRSAGIRQEELEKLNIAKMKATKSQELYRRTLSDFLTIKSVRNNKSPLLLGLSAFVMLTLVSLLFFLVLRSNEEEESRRYLEGRAQSTVKLLYNQLAERMHSLERMALRFKTSDSKGEINWKSDAEAYFKHFRGFQSLIWASKDDNKRWYYPADVSKQDRAIEAGKNQYYQEINKNNLSNKSGIFTNPVLLDHGDLVFMSIHPTGQAVHSGYIIGIYNINEVFSQLLDKRFKFAVYLSNHKLYSQGFLDGELTASNEHFIYNKEYSFYQIWLRNTHFNIYIGAKPELFLSFKNKNAISFLVVLIVLSFLIGIFIAKHNFIHQKLKVLLEEVEVTRSALNEVAAVSYTDMNGLIKNVNERFIKLTRLSREQIIGKDYRRISFFFASDNFLNVLWDQVFDGKIWNGEIMNQAADGSIYWVNTSVVPKKDNSGLILGFTSISIDITAKKKAEEVILEARSVAENALMTKSRFLANMSHEIRTPMNGIVGITTLMLSETKDEKNKNNLKVIKSSCETLHAIVDDILDFSKLEAGKNEVEMVSFDLLACIQNICKLFELEALRKSITFESNISEKMPHWIVGDRVKISQVITNLAGNALKFTDSGKVCISATSSQMKNKTHELKITVTDSGIGISPEAQSKLFKSFSQVDASTTRKFGGTGLGLAISKGLVELMGGRIWVDSKKDQGSTFSFIIPVEEASPQNETPEFSFDSELAKRKPLRILVAEDNPTNQMVITKFLEKFGYSADLATNGLEALEMLEHKVYDLVLMDCHMPKLDGFEATRQIVKKYRLRPKIIALTASSMEIDRKRCLDAGMDDFIAKPLTPVKIMDKLMNFTPLNRDGKSSIVHKNQKNYSLINLDEIGREYQGEEEILENLVKEIKKEIPKYLDELRNLLEKEDYEKIKFCAHSFKGVISNLYVEPMIALLEKIENLDGSKHLELAKDLDEVSEMSKLLIHELQSAFPLTSSAA